MWQELEHTQSWEKVTSEYAPFQIAFTGFDGKRYVHQMAVHYSLITQTRDVIYTKGFRTKIGGQEYYVAPGAILGHKYY